MNLYELAAEVVAGLEADDALLREAGEHFQRQLDKNHKPIR